MSCFQSSLGWIHFTRIKFVLELWNPSKLNEMKNSAHLVDGGALDVSCRNGKGRLMFFEKSPLVAAKCQLTKSHPINITKAETTAKLTPSRPPNEQETFQKHCKPSLNQSINFYENSTVLSEPLEKEQLD